MNKKQTKTTIIENGLMVGFLTYTLSFIITFYWQLDGFNEFNLIFLSIITGLILLIISPIFLYFNIKKFYLNFESDKKPKRRYLIALVMIIAIITIVLIDSIVFFIDDSVSIEYLDYLNSLDPNNIQESVLPMSIYNLATIIIFGFLSYAISVLIIKKNDK